MASSPDWGRVRQEFPALQGIAYLNSATYGQTPNCAINALAEHLHRRNAFACADFLQWFEDADRIRERVALFINAPVAHDIAFIPSATLGLSWLCNGLDWKAGDTIITLRDEFPNNLYAPAALQHLGVKLLEAEWTSLDQHLSPSVRLVLLSSLNYTTGLRPKLEQLGKRLQSTGAYLYVDGTQGTGALQIDVQELQPDMFAVDAYKWMLSPNGAGFAYISKRLREAMRPTTIGWRSDQGWREVNQLHHGYPRFNGYAEQYEGGMLNFPSLYAMGAVVDFLLELGPANIENRVRSLAATCAGVLQELGGQVSFPDSPILSADFPGIDAECIASSLRAEKVFVSARQGRLRVSTHFYNDESDLERLKEGLHRVLPVAAKFTRE